MRFPDPASLQPGTFTEAEIPVGARPSGAPISIPVVIAKGRVTAQGSPDALRAQTGESNLEDAFVKAIGSEEGLQA